MSYFCFWRIFKTDIFQVVVFLGYNRSLKQTLTQLQPRRQHA
jgi:hypothetical protein